MTTSATANARAQVSLVFPNAINRVRPLERSLSHLRPEDRVVDNNPRIVGGLLGQRHLALISHQAVSGRLSLRGERNYDLNQEFPRTLAPHRGYEGSAGQSPLSGTDIPKTSTAEKGFPTSAGALLCDTEKSFTDPLTETGEPERTIAPITVAPIVSDLRVTFLATTPGLILHQGSIDQGFDEYQIGVIGLMERLADGLSQFEGYKPRQQRGWIKLTDYAFQIA